MLEYDSDEIETEILEFIIKTKNSILVNYERAPIELFALHQFCTKYLPKGKPLTIETTIAALMSILEEFEKLDAEELAIASS